MRKTILIGLLVLSGCGGAIGPAGPAGATGATGARGATGNSGSDGMTIQSNFFCSGSHSGLIFIYQAIVYSTGDAQITCAISNTLDTFSNTVVYKSTQTGAQTGGCSLTYDVDAATSGYWTFIVTSGPSASMTYHDTGSASDGTVINFAGGECSIH